MNDELASMLERVTEDCGYDFSCRPEEAIREAERQRCIEENCEYCRGEGSHPMQRTPYRGYRGKFYHILIGNKDDYGPSEILCRATLTHERIYQQDED